MLVMSSWPMASSWSDVARSTSRARLVSHLAMPMALVGPWASRPAELLERGLELGPWHQAVDQADPVRLGRRHVVAEEEQLLGLLDPHQAGQDPGPAGVGGDAPSDEDLDELGLLGHDDEVAGQGEMHAAAGRRAVDARDDRLLAVEDRRRRALASRPGSCGSPRPRRSRGPHRAWAAGAGVQPRRSAPVQKAPGRPAAVITTARTNRSADASRDPVGDLVPHELRSWRCRRRAG